MAEEQKKPRVRGKDKKPRRTEGYQKSAAAHSAFGRYRDDRRDGRGMRKGVVPKRGGLCGLCFVRDGRLDLAKREKVM